MSLDPATFETLTPSQFTVFQIPNPVSHGYCLHTPLIRVAVLDSPITTSSDDVPLIAAMIVPDGRETDWIFCTESGHLQLLFDFAHISRLILIGNNLPLPSISSQPANYNCTHSIFNKEKLEAELNPLVIALHPKLCFKNGVPETLFVTYEDDVLCSVVIERCVGPIVGEFLVEDVEIQSNNHSKNATHKQYRRRLRFKRTPNLIQSQILILPSTDEGLNNFVLDTGVLVHPYLTPMVAGLSLIVSHLNEQIKLGFAPKALCLGVGGGALLSFLNTKLGFDVVGIEADEVVLRIAKQYFGLNDRNSSRLIVGDAIKLIQKVNVDEFQTKFDVVMVDLDSSEARSGISAPPLEFARKPVFEAARFVLRDHGVLIINTIPPSELFHAKLVQELGDVFQDLYEIEVENGWNFVLMAALSPPASNDDDNAFLKKLKCVISGAYMDSIKKL